MKKSYSVEAYLNDNMQYKEALELLRSIILTTELEETIKWNFPVYTLNNKNVLGLGAFKNYFGIWFFNGVFLKDEHNLLVNAQDGKTKAMRQMRFSSIADIKSNFVLDYVNEAIENQKLGKEIKPIKQGKSFAIPETLSNNLNTNTELKISFKALSYYKQKEILRIYIKCEKRNHKSETRRENYSNDFKRYWPKRCI